MPPASSAPRATATVMALALAGCATVGPDFKPPVPPQGASAAGYAMSGDPSSTRPQLSPALPAATPWWQDFGAPQLDQLVRTAFRDNPSVAEMTARLEHAQAETDAAKGGQKPQVDATSGLRRERFNSAQFGFPGFPSSTVNLYSVGSTVSYDLDLFGGRRRGVEQGLARTEAARHEADAAYLSLAANVVREALRMTAIRAQITAAQAIIADDRRIVEMVRRAEAAGGEAPSAQAAPLTQLTQDEADLPQLLRDYAVSRHQLALLVGASPAAWAPPEIDPGQLKTPASIPVSLPSDLVRLRPDILTAEAELHAATAAIGVAAANRYPNIRLSANLSQVTRSPEDIFGYGASGWNIMSGLSAPLSHGGALKARQMAAEADARVAQARYQQTVLRAFVQVSDVLAALAADRQDVDAHLRLQAIAAAKVHEADLVYPLGAATLVQVIDTHLQLNRARRSLAKAQGREYLDLVDLYAATAARWRVAGETGAAAER